MPLLLSEPIHIGTDPTKYTGFVESYFKVLTIFCSFMWSYLSMKMTDYITDFKMD